MCCGEQRNARIECKIYLSDGRAAALVSGTAETGYCFGQVNLLNTDDLLMDLTSVPVQARVIFSFTSLLVYCTIHGDMLLSSGIGC